MTTSTPIPTNMLRYLLATLFVLVIAGCDSNSAATDDFTRVVITEVSIESWPIRQPNGDRWDGFPTENPDLYFDIVDSGGQLILPQRMTTNPT